MCQLTSFTSGSTSSSSKTKKRLSVSSNLRRDEHFSSVIRNAAGLLQKLLQMRNIPDSCAVKMQSLTPRQLQAKTTGSVTLIHYHIVSPLVLQADKNLIRKPPWASTSLFTKVSLSSGAALHQSFHKQRFPKYSSFSRAGTRRKRGLFLKQHCRHCVDAAEWKVTILCGSISKLHVTIFFPLLIKIWDLICNMI